MLKYFRSAQPGPPVLELARPILNDEDEAFLERVTTQSERMPSPPPLPPRPTAAELANLLTTTESVLPEQDLMDETANVESCAATIQRKPLPQQDAAETTKSGFIKMSSKLQHFKHAITWSWLRRDSRNHKHKNDVSVPSPAQAEIAKEQDDMTNILERLNLAAVDNRTFSLSIEWRDLLQQFTLVLKDIINGVPTAWDDLEQLISRSDSQLQDLFSQIPDFLKKLVLSLPVKEAADKAADMALGADVAAELKSKTGKPSLKNIRTPASVAGTLRTIFGVLRARFPAFVGANVLWTLALFLLLFFFWYCRKRGRDVRLESEAAAEVARLEAEWAAKVADPSD